NIAKRCPYIIKFPQFDTPPPLGHPLARRREENEYLFPLSFALRFGIFIKGARRQISRTQMTALPHRF
ncbi:MAG: hypothetical protein ACI4US_04885, partial [Muribaculaceae bacterium]